MATGRLSRCRVGTGHGVQAIERVVFHLSFSKAALLSVEMQFEAQGAFAEVGVG